jgi:hypothetical protein
MTPNLAKKTQHKLRKTQPRKNQHPNEEMAHELNREFSKEEVQMASKYMKKCSPSLFINEM